MASSQNFFYSNGTSGASLQQNVSQYQSQRQAPSQPFGIDKDEPRVCTKSLLVKLSAFTIAIVLIGAIGHQRDTDPFFDRSSSSKRIEQQIPSIFLSENIATNINKYNQTIVDRADTPQYLINLLSAFHSIFSEFVYVDKPLTTSFIYGYGDGYNDTNDGPCFNETVSPLREQYAWNQKYLVSLLSPKDPHQHPLEPVVDANESQVPLDEILGGYGGGFQLYCNGRMLVTSGGGASFSDKKYPSFLDLDDLFDLNSFHLYDDDGIDDDDDELLDDLVFHGGGGMQLYMRNIRYVRNRYCEEDRANGKVISIGGEFNETSDMDQVYEHWKAENDDLSEHFDKYLAVMLDEMVNCYSANYPHNNKTHGLWLFGGGGGSAWNGCEYDGLSREGYFYDYYMSNW